LHRGFELSAVSESLKTLRGKLRMAAWTFGPGRKPRPEAAAPAPRPSAVPEPHVVQIGGLAEPAAVVGGR
jgi:hypothetical protein